MPKKRLPIDLWREVRCKVWERDKGRCQGPYCQDKPEWSLELDQCHIDHIKSGKRANNALSNLRTLCRFCHCLRADNRHRGMVARALRDGIIPSNWRELVWEG